MTPKKWYAPILCFFGLHDWFEPNTVNPYCQNCGRIYPRQVVPHRINCLDALDAGLPCRCSVAAVGGVMGKRRELEMKQAIAAELMPSRISDNLPNAQE